MESAQFVSVLTNVFMLLFLWSIGPALAIASSAFAGNHDDHYIAVVLGILSLLPFAVAIEWGKRQGGAGTLVAAVPAEVPVAAMKRIAKRV